MGSSAFPAVIAGMLATTAAAVPTVRVVRGRDTSSDPGDVIMVGISDYPGDTLGWDSAGAFDQEFQTFGTNRSETGRVNCLALSRNGDGDRAAACQAVFDLIVAVETAVRANQSLGVTSLEYLVANVETGAVRESSNDEGATAVLSFGIFYQART